MGTKRTIRSKQGGFVLVAGWVLAILAFGSPPAAVGFPVIEQIPELHGAPRRWEAGMAVSPFSTLNLRSGRMLTTLPIVGWEGRGPSISFSLYHNMTSPLGTLPLEGSGGGGQGLMGDSNGDGGLDEGDIDPFLDIVLSGEATAEEVAIADFSGDAQADSGDVGGFIETLSMVLGGTAWTHSYSAHLDFITPLQGGQPTNVSLIRDDGTKDKFTLYSGAYVSPPGVFETLTWEYNAQNETTGFLLTSKNQWRAHFTEEGKLDWIADATVEEESAGIPKNRVQCIYSDGLPEQPPWGKLWKVQDAAGRLLVLTYNPSGRIKEIKDPVNRVWKLLYEKLPSDVEDGNEPYRCGQSGSEPCTGGSGPFVALLDANPAHPPITWGYTEEDEIYWIADKNYDTYTFEYFEGRLVDVWDPLGLLQSFAWSGTMNNESIGRYYDRRGSEWEYWFKSAVTAFVGGQWRSFSTGNLTKVVYPLGEVVQFEHHDVRNPPGTGPTSYGSNWYLPHRHEVTARLNPLWKRWEYEYAPADEPEVAEDVLQRGNLARATDPLGNEWQWGYDGLSNLTLIAQPDDSVPGLYITTNIEYTATDVDPTVPTRMTLPPDQFGVPAIVDVTYWNAAAYGGNALGKLKSVRDANGVETLFRYDSRGQLSMVAEGPITATLPINNWRKTFSFANINPVSDAVEERQFGYEETNSGEEPGTETELRLCLVPIICPTDAKRQKASECGCPAGWECACVHPHWPPCPEREAQSCPVPALEEGEPPVETQTGYTIPNVCPPENIAGSLKGPTDIMRDAMGRSLSITSVGHDTSVLNDYFEATQTIAYDPLGRVQSNQVETDEPRGGYHAGDLITRAFSYGYDDINGVHTRTGPDGLTTTTETDTAGRVIHTERAGLSADYLYYATGNLQRVTYGNGAVIEYEYDDAERLTTIRHRSSLGGPVILELDYLYTPRGLIYQIAETDASGPQAVTTYTYDRRGRLIEEKRVDGHPYWLTYTYDLGGNRLTKTQKDASGAILLETSYHYDTDAGQVDCDGDTYPDTTAAECYRTKNNRLMYYEVRRPNDEIIERVRYQYAVEGVARGNPTYIVRELFDVNPIQNYGYTLQYNSSGELWFITQTHWQYNNCNAGPPTIVSRHEFRSVGRAMRLTRERDVESPWVAKLGTQVWHDYDGDEIYADARMEVDWQYPIEVTEKAAHEPGVGMIDRQTTVKSYHHSDQIGSTRAITDEAATISGRIVYTAFGERVGSDGTVGTRYQYAGAHGYQSELYADASNEPPFVHVGHRWYDPATGRFLQRDPIGINGGFNVYVYLDNQPTFDIDPSGLAPWHPGVGGAFWNWWTGGDATGDLYLDTTGGRHSWLDCPTTVRNVALVSAGVGVAAAGGAFTCAILGFNPWLGAIAIHAPHAGGPHQFWHLQFMLRTGAHTTRHFRIPL